MEKTKTKIDFSPKFLLFIFDKSSTLKKMHSCLISHSIKFLIGIINRRKHKINKLKVVSSKTFVCKLQQKLFWFK